LTPVKGPCQERAPPRSKWSGATAGRGREVSRGPGEAVGRRDTPFQRCAGAPAYPPPPPRTATATHSHRPPSQRSSTKQCRLSCLFICSMFILPVAVPLKIVWSFSSRMILRRSLGSCGQGRAGGVGGRGERPVGGPRVRGGRTPRGGHRRRRRRRAPRGGRARSPGARGAGARRRGPRWARQGPRRRPAAPPPPRPPPAHLEVVPLDVLPHLLDDHAPVHLLHPQERLHLRRQDRPEALPPLGVAAGGGLGRGVPGLLVPRRRTVRVPRLVLCGDAGRRGDRIAGAPGLSARARPGAAPRRAPRVDPPAAHLARRGEPRSGP